MNNYHIQEEVGRGKYSVVYKGRKKQSIEYVAIKSVERGRRKKLMDEVAIFQQIENDHISQFAIQGSSSDPSQKEEQSSAKRTALDNWHPNILKFYNWYETRNHFWIILEYCCGGDLYSLLDQDKKLPEESVKKFTYELLEGLSYLHSQGVIFGDLKPQNIMINEYHKLKLSDFGLAKKVTELSNLGIKNSAEERASSHSQANSNSKNKSGTPYYMAPELFQDTGVYSYFSDFWSLGCIMIEMATGKPPFYTQSLQELIQQIVVKQVPVINGFSDQFNDFVQKMLQKDPVKRINWEEIKRHPWWTTKIEQFPNQPNQQASERQSGAVPHFFEKDKKAVYHFTKRIYQPQLHFDKYLINVRGIEPGRQYQAARNARVAIPQQIAENSGSQIDALRISQQVIKNLQVEEKEQPYGARQSSKMENTQKLFQQQKGSQSLYSFPSNQDSIQHNQLGQPVSDYNDEFNQYNSNVQNRNSKLQKNNSIDDFDNDAQNIQAVNPKNDIANDLDFYQAQNKNLAQAIESERNKFENYNGGQKQQIEFQKQEFKIEEEQKQSYQNPKPQIISPHPNKAPQPLSASKANPIVVKQNNFFSPNENKQSKQAYQMPNQNVSPQHLMSNQDQRQGSSSQLQVSNQNNFKAQTQQLFKSNLQDSGVKPPQQPGYQADAMSFEAGLQAIQDRKVGVQNNKQEIQKRISPMQNSSNLEQNPKASLIKNIDRFNFLNDQFDNFDDFDNNNMIQENQNQNIIRSGSAQAFQSNQELNNQSKYEYHQPSDPDHSLSTLKMVKDFTLFNSPLSQAQIKSEVQTLVTQTVQIGPVQNQGAGSQGGGMTSTGASSFSQGSSSSLGKIGSDHSSVSNRSNFNQGDPGSSNIMGLSGAQPTQMKVPHKTIEQLIIHNSDTAVKPIVGNKEIERIVESVYNPQHLKFTPWSSDEVIAKINTTQIESHLSDVYTSIASNTTINEKISTLQYFESIIVNSNVSNSLINSVFMALLKKMLEQIKSPMIKIRVCSVVGLLIRHSTIIDNELAEIDIASQLIDTLRDSNEKVRRRAIAALGEYMFYAATQLDDEMADPVWELSDDAIEIIVQSLDSSEPDQIVRFYACKTLENICAQSTTTGHRFANLNTVQQVLNIFMMESNDPGIEHQEAEQQTYAQWYEGIRISAAIALSHICKLNPKLFPVIFETITPSRFCETLMHGNGQSRVQQAFITMLNLALHNIYYPQISSILLQERVFLQALTKLLEHQHIVIRGKCILTFLLLIKLDFRWMTTIQHEIKFFNELDKILRDNYKYVQCCLLCLAEGIQDIVPTIFKTICEKLIEQSDNSKNKHLGLNNQDIEDEDLTNLDFQVDKNGNNDYGDFSDITTSQLYHITILLDLQINPLIRSRLLSSPMIQALAAMLDVCDVNSFKGSRQFMNALLIMSENLSSNYKVLQILVQPVLTLLVPVLFDKLTNSKSDDIKFLSFKIFTDIMTQYIADESVYNVPLSPQSNQNSFVGLQSSEVINRIIENQILPKTLMVLKECQDPIPMFGLKLLNSIIERNQEFIPKLKEICESPIPQENPNLILETLGQFYQVNHPKLNRQTINLIKKFVECNEFGVKDLKDLNILHNTNQLVTSMIKNRQEWSLELMLDILHGLLSTFNDLVKGQQEEQIVYLIDQIFNNFESCVQLLNLQYDISLVEKSSQCLIQMLQLYAQSNPRLRLRDIYFIESHFEHLMSAIKSDRILVQKRVLKCIYWALIQNEYQITLPPQVVQQLEQQIEQMIVSQDRSISHTSREVQRLLSQQRQEQILEQPVEQPPKSLPSFQSLSGSGNISLNQPQGAPQASNQYSQYSQYSQQFGQNKN